MLMSTGTESRLLGDKDPSQGGADALLPCDIVMAGGVTSGIIYPGAVAMIARHFSFHSIGGTSVGAIAAAATAAAEYGRRTGTNPSSFDQIAALPKSLGETASDSRSRLFHLFTPDDGTKGLLALLMPLIGRSGTRSRIAGLLGSLVSVWQISVPTLVAGLAGVLLVSSLAWDGRMALAAIAVIASAALACAVALMMLVLMLQRRWLPAWRANGYGICTGNALSALKQKSGQAAFLGLTPWIHEVVQRAAGRQSHERPLTFGDLWAGSVPEEVTQPADPAAPRAIELSMIASDISRNRSIQLPFIETPSPLYVEISTLRRYFPEPVVTWMVDRQGRYSERVEKREGVIRLPEPQDLPIVFGARLSLSFPILLSAVPLLTPDFAKHKSGGGLTPLRSIWISDGGLTSNFPIHFFDSPLPSRPTFCLNLVDFDAEAPDDETSDVELAEFGDSTSEGKASESGAKPVERPRAPERKAERRPDETAVADPEPGDEVWGFVSMAKGNRIAPVPFTDFDAAPGSGLGSFLSTLLNTARFWSDNELLVAPGVRDRVVHIALRDDEGGLNLDMAPKVIADLDRRGRAAGLLISARFSPLTKRDPETGQPNRQVFANHRWVRFRNFMAAFEDLSRRFATARRKSDDAALRRDEPLLDDMIAGKVAEIGYPAPAASRDYYRATTADLEQLALKMAATTRADPNASFDRPRPVAAERGRAPAGAAPRPKMRIRLRPLVGNDPRAENADLPDAAV
jgi:predicted acylesterase/phospholipase RssA